MRIVVDLASTGGQATGLGAYAGPLFAELRRIAPQHEWIGLNLVRRNLSTPARIFYDQVRLPLAAKRLHPDVLFVPAFSAPVLYHGKKVMTVHDLAGILFPEIFSRSSRVYWGKLLPASAYHCQAILVPSHTTAKDVNDRLGIPSERIHVTPLGVRSGIGLTEDVSAIQSTLKKFNLDRPFVLSVGTREPRKNFPRLLEAFARARRENHQLVLVGTAAWGQGEIEKVIRQFHLQTAVRLLDYLDASDLNALYNACTAFALVSLYEGFGLPVLEAMACGAPVLISDRGSLPEVGGDAAIQVNPYQIDSITEKLNLLLRDSDLRTRMQRASLKQAQKFSWEKTARATLAVLEQV